MKQPKDLQKPIQWALAEGYVPQKLTELWDFEEAKKYFNQYEYISPIHVIEYSAYQSLQSKLEKAEAENKRLREALEFYSNSRNWKEKKTYYETTDLIVDDSDEYYCEVRHMWVGGKRARQALKGEEES